MSKIAELLEKIKDSQAYQELKGKYDELDGQTKVYINLGAVAAVVLFVFLSITISMGKLRGMKTEIDDREVLIGYLQQSGDTIRQLKAKQSNNRGADTSSPLATFVDNIIGSSNIDRTKVDVGTERAGADDKEAKETLVDIKMNQVNLRQIVRLLFNLTEQGKARSVTVKDLTIDTKADPAGYMDAVFTIADYKAK